MRKSKGVEKWKKENPSFFHFGFFSFSGIS